MNWEYKVVTKATTGFTGGKFDPEELNRWMNELGLKGWELASSFDTNYGQGATREIVLLFKRGL